MNKNNLEIGLIFKEAFELLRAHFATLLLIFLIGLGLGLILVIPFLWLPFLVPIIVLFTKSLGVVGIALLSILVLVWALVAILIGVWIQAAYFEATASLIKKEKLEVWLPFKKSFKKLWLYFSTSFLVGVIILLGLIFLIIPGIWLAIRLYLALMLVARENKGAIAATRGSFQLTKGYGFLIFLIALILVGLTALISFIPLLGGILASFVSICGVLLQAVLYKQIKGLE